MPRTTRRSDPKPSLKVYEFQADAPAIAKALYIEEPEVVSAFRDGRVVSRFGEYWASKVYAYQRERSSNAPFSDGFLEGALGFKISVKSLSAAGVKFQQSRDQGTQRSGTALSLRNAIRRSDRHLVVDCSEFPRLRMVAVPSNFLLQRANDDALTLSGWKPTRFYRELEEAFDVKYLPHKLGKPAPME